MSDNDFFEWFAEKNPDVPKGTVVTAAYDYFANQVIVTYVLGGNPVKRVYNVDYEGGQPKFEELVRE